MWLAKPGPLSHRAQSDIRINIHTLIASTFLVLLSAAHHVFFMTNRLWIPVWLNIKMYKEINKTSVLGVSAL